MEKNARKIELEVLCVTTKLGTGGVQTFLINNVEPLLKLGIRLNFAVQIHEPQVFDEKVLGLGCRIFKVTPLWESKIQFMKDIRAVLRQNPEIKIVHAHQNFANIYPLVASKGLAKTVSHSHSNYSPKSFINKILKSCFKVLLPVFADEYWGCSNPAVKWLYGKHSNSPKCRIINNAIDTNRFKYNVSRRAVIRKDLNIDDKKVWIHVGTLSDAKNHEFLLSLFSKSLQKNKDQHLILCGDGILREKIENLIRRLNLSGQVSLLGNVQNAEDYLSASDIFVFPSLYEGFGLSVIEAESTGINCVVSKAIPDDCLLCPNVIKPEKLDFDIWLKAIERVNDKPINRENAFTIIENAGYDIASEAAKIAGYYKNLNAE